MFIKSVPNMHHNDKAVSIILQKWNTVTENDPHVL